MISERELREIAQKGSVLRNFEQWCQYHPGTIIFMFQADEFTPTLDKFAVSIATARDLNPGDYLYVLEFAYLQLHRIQEDTTAFNWPNSKIYLEPISANQTKVVARMCLEGQTPTLLKNGSKEIFQPPKTIQQILKSGRDEAGSVGLPPAASERLKTRIPSITQTSSVQGQS
jgi:hypothetical protein